MREAEAAGQLSSPHVVQIHEIGDKDSLESAVRGELEQEVRTHADMLIAERPWKGE